MDDFKIKAPYVQGPVMTDAQLEDYATMANMTLSMPSAAVTTLINELRSLRERVNDRYWEGIRAENNELRKRLHRYELPREEIQARADADHDNKSGRCLWCGRSYAEHADKIVNDMVPRMPCHGLKSGFTRG